MDKVKTLKRKYLLFLFTGFIIGLLFGTITLNTFISYRIDTYLQQIKYLETIIEDKNTRLKILEESINKKRFILKEIQIFLLTEEDQIDQLTLEKHIKQKYNKLLGKEVKQIDMDLVGDIIDNRIMKIDGKEYKLKVYKLALTEILKIWIKVEKINH
ncbi:hypothetical protein FQB35_04860 [Crassaminicella thermophila]|uniref:Sporulation membrane protein YtrI C-terminal domain-containing protein n=1 Tax=Crassaminicella thermophila TaxID=2599308 RepID=A0A5C0SFQ4_CRATE|nr:hypothetical protein [Crassaminicella thermophila]QEK11749.1 hypothetical protein FQB35_04860 [Crassaminicella thermophila]